MKIILGASGHGKSHELYKRVVDAACNEANRNFYIIVPEQNSLQVEKDILALHPNHGMFNINVLTFGRMTFRIFDELGIELNENIDELGKTLIVRKVVGQVADRLKIIKASKKPGLIGEVKSLISELKQYGISSDDLERIIDGNSFGDRLSQKLKDVEVIYAAFEEYIAGRFTTTEDRPEAMLSVMDRSHYFDDAVVYFDNFTGFTPVQYRIIEKVMEKANEMMFFVNLPDDEAYNQMGGEEELFHMSKEMIARLGSLCDEHHTDFRVERIETDFDSYRYKNSSELAFLEKNVFRYNGRTYKEETKDIEIRQLDNPLEEVQCLAADIIDNVQNKGMMFRDMGVILGDVSLYATEIERVFSEARIPFFIDYKHPLIGNPLVEYLRALLEISTTDFSYESIFRFLKNGLCEIPSDEIDILENYILAYNIRGKNRWSENFVREYPGAKKNDLTIVNHTRKTFFENIASVMDILMNRETTVSERIAALYQFTEEMGAFEKMEALSENLKEKHPDSTFFLAKSSEYSKIYNCVIKYFEQIEELLGDEVMSVQEFALLVDAGFESLSVAMLPVSVDCVTIGDIDRTRLEHIRVLYMLGANEGVIPHISNNNGILSEAERKKLDDASVELAPDSTKKTFIQNYYMYLHMTKPSERLLLFYHKFDAEGKSQKPSRILSVITRMFPKVKKRTSSDISLVERITNIDNSKHLLTDSNYNSSIGPLMMFFLANEPYASDIRRMFEIYAKTEETDSLTKKVAQELYTDMKTGSISRLETFAGCAFRHFAQYGIELSERKLYELNPIELGTIIHEAVEYISRELKSKGKNFGNLAAEECKTVAENYVNRAMHSHTGTFFVDSSTNRYLFTRIVDMVARTIWALGEQLRHGKFVPEEFEWKFDTLYKDMPISGKVDRYDLAYEDDRIYAKVIDYKSSPQSLDINEIYAGLKLQLMVYLGEVVDKLSADNADKKVIGAAAFYNPVLDPIVDASDDVERDILKKLKPSGILAIESVGLLDEWEKNTSDVIPARMGKEGIKHGKTVFTGEQIKCLTKFAHEKMYNLNERMHDGVVEANPYEDKCDYCPYNSVCGFDNIRQDYRRVDKVSDNPDLWKLFGLGGDDDGGMD